MKKITLVPATKLSFMTSLAILVIWTIVFIFSPISSIIGGLIFLPIVIICIINLPKSGVHNSPNHVNNSKTEVILSVVAIVLLVILINVKFAISTHMIKNDLYSTVSGLDLPKTLKLQSDVFQHTPGDIDVTQISSYTFTYLVSGDIPAITEQLVQSLKLQGYNILLTTQYTNSSGSSIQEPTGAYKGKGRIVINFYPGFSPHTFQIVAQWNYDYQQPQYVGN